jgi:hypothetical protein
METTGRLVAQETWISLFPIRSDNGTLTFNIMKDGKILDGKSTDAQYGVVSVSRECH